MSEKINIRDILATVNYGAHTVWDDLTIDQQKQVNFWLLNRWVSNVSGTREEQELALLKTNSFYNKNWNVLGTKHPKLQFQLLCMSSNTQKIQRHNWIGFKKRSSSDNKIIKFVRELFPNMKEDEVHLFARINTKEEIRELASDLGYEKRNIPI